jgi:hypothetical protein
MLNKYCFQREYRFNSQSVIKSFKEISDEDNFTSIGSSNARRFFSNCVSKNLQRLYV